MARRHHRPDRLYDRSGEHVRRFPGRKPRSSGVLLDHQTVKTTAHAGPRGYDGGKKIVGRKRHAVVETVNLL